MVKSFTELTENEMLECHKFITEKKKNSKQSFNEFIKYYCGEEFNKGDNCFAALNGGNVEGIIGVVTKEIPVRKEAFIFNFYGKESALDRAAELLRKAVEVCIDCKSPAAKLGVGPVSARELQQVIMEQGFNSCYEALIMKLNLSEPFPCSDMEELSFILLENDNIDEYVRIHNNAFRRTPNGGDTTAEELKEMLKERVDKPELIGLVKYNGLYVGGYELEIKGETGWINVVGVHEDYCGKGFGKWIVVKCVNLLLGFGVREIKLNVISSNEKAFNLYKKLGFIKDEILSSWFVKKLFD